MALYHYRRTDTFPRKLTDLQLPYYGQISSVEVVGNSFNYHNFTLQVSVSDLQQLAGSSVSCGSELQRSNNITFGNFSLIGMFYLSISNVRYAAYLINNSIKFYFQIIYTLLCKKIQKCGKKVKYLTFLIHSLCNLKYINCLDISRNDNLDVLYTAHYGGENVTLANFSLQWTFMVST